MKPFDLEKHSLDGDVIVTTDLSPASMLIKSHTWGIRDVFNQNKGSHIAVRATDEHGKAVYAEMKATRRVTRYINRESGQVLLPDQYMLLDPTDWSRYNRVRLRTGFVFSRADCYGTRGPGKHVVAVLRHPDCQHKSFRDRANRWIMVAYVSARIVYDGNGIIEFNKINHFVKWDDKADEWICSEVPRDMFRFLGCSYPDGWNAQVSPMDHQVWPGYVVVYKGRGA